MIELKITDVVELGNMDLFVREPWQDRPEGSEWACWITIGLILGMAFASALSL